MTLLRHRLENRLVRINRPAQTDVFVLPVPDDAVLLTRLEATTALRTPPNGVQDGFGLHNVSWLLGYNTVDRNRLVPNAGTDVQNGVIVYRTRPYDGQSFSVPLTVPAGENLFFYQRAYLPKPRVYFNNAPAAPGQGVIFPLTEEGIAFPDAQGNSYRGWFTRDFNPNAATVGNLYVEWGGLYPTAPDDRYAPQHMGTLLVQTAANRRSLVQGDVQFGHYQGLQQGIVTEKPHIRVWELFQPVETADELLVTYRDSPDKHPDAAKPYAVWLSAWFLCRHPDVEALPADERMNQYLRMAASGMVVADVNLKP